MANAFPSVSGIGVCAAMQTRGVALHRWDASNLSGEEQFQRAGLIGTDQQGGYDGPATEGPAAFYRWCCQRYGGGAYDEWLK
jgi:hypothetical protein